MSVDFSVRERVLSGWATYIASQLSTTIERNRPAPLDLKPGGAAYCFVDGNDAEFPEDESMNVVARGLEFSVEIYKRAPLGVIGTWLNEEAAKLQQIVYRNRGLAIEGDPELCRPAETACAETEIDIWREKGVEPGGSITCTFRVVFAHTWDDPFELA